MRTRSKRQIIGFAICLVALFGITPLRVIGISRSIQSFDVASIFQWASTVNVGKSHIPLSLGLPITLVGSGLPDKVVPGESFQVPFSVAFGTGSQFAIAGHQISLDSIISAALSYIPNEIDLRPYVAIVTCVVAYFVLAPGEFQLACGLDGTGQTNGLVHELLQYIQLRIENYLSVNVFGSGPISIANDVIRTWFGDKTDVTVSINANAQREFSWSIVC